MMYNVTDKGCGTWPVTVLILSK